MDSLFNWFWEDGAFYVLYVLLAIAALNITKNIIEVPLKERVNQFQYRYRLRKIKSNHSKSAGLNNPFLKHIYLIIKTTSKERSEQDVISFVIITGLMFLTTAIMVFIRMQDALIAVFLGVLVGMIPYMILQIRLRKLRYLLGEELLYIIQSLTQNYNANQYDMYHALIATQNDIKDATLRKIILKLITDLQIAKNEEELRLAVSVFVYTAGSSWSKRLGSIIVKSYLYNENVLQTLLVLTRQIEETEEMLEQEKSNTLDTVFNGYLTIPIFIASIILGYFVSGAQDWFNLQFGNQWALLLFFICVIGVVFSIFISMILKRPKNDL